MRRAWALGVCSVSFGFKVEGLRFRILDFRFRAEGLGF